MNFHTRAKLHQVLLNLIAAELKVSDLRRLASVFASYDTSCSGLLSSTDFEEALIELGVMPESVAQVLHALITDPQLKVPYNVFVASCVDLVDDKLDHMLWKVFSFVDEDCSGEVGTIELEHFLTTASGSGYTPRSTASEADASYGYAGSHSRAKEVSRSFASDMERYLRGVLPPDLDVTEAVACMARGRDVVAFEDLKLFVLGGRTAF
jgi:Ca2+-binding EF-hand superfamily protein